MFFFFFYFKTLKAHKTDYYENLKLAIKWNQVKIAKTHIFTGEEKLSKLQRYSLMELAIVEDKSDFVELFIEMNLIDLSAFLTHRRLLFFYNSNKVFK